MYISLQTYLTYISICRVYLSCILICVTPSHVSLCREYISICIESEVYMLICETQVADVKPSLSWPSLTRARIMKAPLFNTFWAGASQMTVIVIKTLETCIISTRLSSSPKEMSDGPK
jgi:hypothetical protein